MLRSFLRHSVSTRGMLGVSMKPNMQDTRMKPSEIFSTVIRSLLGTRGLSETLIDKMMLRSCSTRLCFKLCIKDVGAASGSPVRKTAVPDTRCGGLASSFRISQLRSASLLRVSLVSNRDPRIHVSMVRPMTPAIMIGNQPPSRTFNRLAVRNVCSIRASGRMVTAAFHSGHFQYFQITKKAMMLSINMAAVTDTP